MASQFHNSASFGVFSAENIPPLQDALNDDNRSSADCALFGTYDAAEEDSSSVHPSAQTQQGEAVAGGANVEFQKLLESLRKGALPLTLSSRCAVLSFVEQMVAEERAVSCVLELLQKHILAPILDRSGMVVLGDGSGSIVMRGSSMPSATISGGGGGGLIDPSLLQAQTHPSLAGRAKEEDEEERSGAALNDKNTNPPPPSHKRTLSVSEMAKNFKEQHVSSSSSATAANQQPNIPSFSSSSPRSTTAASVWNASIVGGGGTSSTSPAFGTNSNNSATMAAAAAATGFSATRLFGTNEVIPPLLSLEHVRTMFGSLSQLLEAHRFLMRHLIAKTNSIREETEAFLREMEREAEEECEEEETEQLLGGTFSNGSTTKTGEGAFRRNEGENPIKKRRTSIAAASATTNIKSVSEAFNHASVNFYLTQQGTYASELLKVVAPALFLSQIVGGGGLRCGGLNAAAGADHHGYHSSLLANTTIDGRASSSLNTTINSGGGGGGASSASLLYSPDDVRISLLSRGIVSSNTQIATALDLLKQSLVASANAAAARNSATPAPSTANSKSGNNANSSSSSSATAATESSAAEGTVDTDSVASADFRALLLRSERLSDVQLNEWNAFLKHALEKIRVELESRSRGIYQHDDHHGLLPNTTATTTAAVEPAAGNAFEGDALMDFAAASPAPIINNSTLDSNNTTLIDGGGCGGDDYGAAFQNNNAPPLTVHAPLIATMLPPFAATVNNNNNAAAPTSANTFNTRSPSPGTIMPPSNEGGERSMSMGGGGLAPNRTHSPSAGGTFNNNNNNVPNEPTSRATQGGFFDTRVSAAVGNVGGGGGGGGAFYDPSATSASMGGGMGGMMGGGPSATTNNNSQRKRKLTPAEQRLEQTVRRLQSISIDDSTQQLLMLMAVPLASSNRLLAVARCLREIQWEDLWLDVTLKIESVAHKIPSTADSLMKEAVGRLGGGGGGGSSLSSPRVGNNGDHHHHLLHPNHSASSSLLPPLARSASSAAMKRNASIGDLRQLRSTQSGSNAATTTAQQQLQQQNSTTLRQHHDPSMPLLGATVRGAGAGGASSGGKAGGRAAGDDADEDEKVADAATSFVRQTVLEQLGVSTTTTTETHNENDHTAAVAATAVSELDDFAARWSRNARSARLLGLRQTSSVSCSSALLSLEQPLVMTEKQLKGLSKTFQDTSNKESSASASSAGGGEFSIPGPFRSLATVIGRTISDALTSGKKATDGAAGGSPCSDPGQTGLLLSSAYSPRTLLHSGRLQKRFGNLYQRSHERFMFLFNDVLFYVCEEPDRKVMSMAEATAAKKEQRRRRHAKALAQLEKEQHRLSAVAAALKNRQQQQQQSVVSNSKLAPVAVAVAGSTSSNSNAATAARTAASTDDQQPSTSSLSTRRDGGNGRSAGGGSLQQLDTALLTNNIGLNSTGQQDVSPTASVNTTTDPLLSKKPKKIVSDKEAAAIFGEHSAIRSAPSASSNPRIGLLVSDNNGSPAVSELSVSAAANLAATAVTGKRKIGGGGKGGGGGLFGACCSTDDTDDRSERRTTALPLTTTTSSRSQRSVVGGNDSKKKKPSSDPSLFTSDTVSASNTTAAVIGSPIPTRSLRDDTDTIDDDEVYSPPASNVRAGAPPAAAEEEGFGVDDGLNDDRRQPTPSMPADEPLRDKDGSEQDSSSHRDSPLYSDAANGTNASPPLVFKSSRRRRLSEDGNNDGEGEGEEEGGGYEDEDPTDMTASLRAKEEGNTKLLAGGSKSGGNVINRNNTNSNAKANLPPATATVGFEQSALLREGSMARRHQSFGRRASIQKGGVGGGASSAVTTAASMAAKDRAALGGGGVGAAANAVSTTAAGGGGAASSAILGSSSADYYASNASLAGYTVMRYELSAVFPLRLRPLMQVFDLETDDVNNVSATSGRTRLGFLSFSSSGLARNVVQSALEAAVKDDRLKQCCFILVIPSRSYVFLAPSRDEKQRWVFMIRKAIADANPDVTNPGPLSSPYEPYVHRAIASLIQQQQQRQQLAAGTATTSSVGADAAAANVNNGNSKREKRGAILDLEAQPVTENTSFTSCNNRMAASGDGQPRSTASSLGKVSGGRATPPTTTKSNGSFLSATTVAPKTPPRSSNNLAISGGGGDAQSETAFSPTTTAAQRTLTNFTDSSSIMFSPRALRATGVFTSDAYGNSRRDNNANHDGKQRKVQKKTVFSAYFEKLTVSQAKEVESLRNIMAAARTFALNTFPQPPQIELGRGSALHAASAASPPALPFVSPFSPAVSSNASPYGGGGLLSPLLASPLFNVGDGLHSAAGGSSLLGCAPSSSPTAQHHAQQTQRIKPLSRLTQQRLLDVYLYQHPLSCYSLDQQRVAARGQMQMVYDTTTTTSSATVGANSPSTTQPSSFVDMGGRGTVVFDSSASGNTSAHNRMTGRVSSGGYIGLGGRRSSNVASYAAGKAEPAGGGRDSYFANNTISRLSSSPSPHRATVRFEGDVHDAHNNNNRHLDENALTPANRPTIGMRTSASTSNLLLDQQTTPAPPTQLDASAATPAPKSASAGREEAPAAFLPSHSNSSTSNTIVHQQDQPATATTSISDAAITSAQQHDDSVTAPYASPSPLQHHDNRGGEEESSAFLAAGVVSPTDSTSSPAVQNAVKSIPTIKSLGDLTLPPRHSRVESSAAAVAAAMSSLMNGGGAGVGDGSFSSPQQQHYHSRTVSTTAAAAGLGGGVGVTSPLQNVSFSHQQQQPGSPNHRRNESQRTSVRWSTYFRSSAAFSSTAAKTADPNSNNAETASSPNHLHSGVEGRGAILHKLAVVDDDEEDEALAAAMLAAAINEADRELAEQQTQKASAAHRNNNDDDDDDTATVRRPPPRSELKTADVDCYTATVDDGMGSEDEEGPASENSSKNATFNGTAVAASGKESAPVSFSGGAALAATAARTVANNVSFVRPPIATPRQQNTYNSNSGGSATNRSPQKKQQQQQRSSSTPSASGSGKLITLTPPRVFDEPHEDEGEGRADAGEKKNRTAMPIVGSEEYHPTSPLLNFGKGDEEGAVIASSSRFVSAESTPSKGPRPPAAFDAPSFADHRSRTTSVNGGIATTTTTTTTTTTNNTKSGEAKKKGGYQALQEKLNDLRHTETSDDDE